MRRPVDEDRQQDHLEGEVQQGMDRGLWLSAETECQIDVGHGVGDEVGVGLGVGVSVTVGVAVLVGIAVGVIVGWDNPSPSQAENSTALATMSNTIIILFIYPSLAEGDLPISL